jgi:hypothetical protein
VLGDDSSSNSPEFSLNGHFISLANLLTTLHSRFLLAISYSPPQPLLATIDSALALSNFNRANRSRHSAPTNLI